MSDVPRGKALYITFNGGDIEPGFNMTAEGQVCDKEESPKIRVYLRVLYSAVCYHGTKDVALADFAAAVVPRLKSLRLKCAREVVRACSALLQLKPGENILVAADELAELGKQRAVGEVSEEAVLGLKALVELSTASLVDRQGNRELGALYVCASAYTAYNPAKGITEGSNRRVYYMPLPPLSVEMDDEKLKKLYSGPALTCACSFLWSSQSNARAYGYVLRNLVQEGAKLMEKQRSKISEVHQVPSTTRNFFSRCNEFLAGCERLSMYPLQLLHILFWPLPFDKDTTCFDNGFLAAVLGDAAGLCTILRDHTAVWTVCTGIQELYSNLLRN